MTDPTADQAPSSATVTVELDTAIGQANAESIQIRGYDLVADLIGSASYTEATLLTVTGQRPTLPQVRVLDAVLVSLIDHGLQPSAVAARMTYSVAPEAVQGAVAAGLLGTGTVLLGSMEQSAKLLSEIRHAVAGGSDPVAAVDEALRRLVTDGRRIPGLGHRLHRDGDPRAKRLLDVAEANGVAAGEVELLHLVERRAAELTRRQLPLNATAAAGALLLGLGVPWQLHRGFAMISRIAGLVAHIGEEIDNPMTPALRDAFRSASWL